MGPFCANEACTTAADEWVTHSLCIGNRTIFNKSLSINLLCVIEPDLKDETIEANEVCVCVKWINCIWRLASSNTRTKPTQLYTYNDSRNVVRRRRQRHFLLHQRPGTSDGHLRQATWATFWQIKKKRKKYLENISNSPWTMNAHYIWWNKWNETKLEPIGKIRRQINEDWVERKREIKIAQWKVENGYDIEKRTE